MITVPQLLDAARLGSTIPSDYRLARVLRVSDTALYTYRHAGRVPVDDVVVKLADLAKLPAPYVLNCMAAERSKEPAVRAAFLAAAAALKPPGSDKMPPSAKGGGGSETPMDKGSARFGDVHPLGSLAIHCSKLRKWRKCCISLGGLQLYDRPVADPITQAHLLSGSACPFR